MNLHMNSLQRQLPIAGAGCAIAMLFVEFAIDVSSGICSGEKRPESIRFVPFLIAMVALAKAPPLHSYRALELSIVQDHASLMAKGNMKPLVDTGLAGWSYFFCVLSLVHEFAFLLSVCTLGTPTTPVIVAAAALDIGLTALCFNLNRRYSAEMYI